jgi:ATP phosphoribosyltransferase
MSAFQRRQPAADPGPVQGPHFRRHPAAAGSGRHHRAENPETSRKLILATNDPDVRVIIVRATDVPTYVQHGAADFGVAGKDVLLEHGGEGLYQPIDLNIACCRMSVAVKPASTTRPRCARARACAWPPSSCRRRASTSPRRACTST